MHILRTLYMLSCRCYVCKHAWLAFHAEFTCNVDISSRGTRTPVMTKTSLGVPSRPIWWWHMVTSQGTRATLTWVHCLRRCLMMINLQELLLPTVGDYCIMPSQCSDFWAVIVGRCVVGLHGDSRDPRVGILMDNLRCRLLELHMGSVQETVGR